MIILKMDQTETFGSQESLPLSQETFDYLWTELNRNDKSDGIKPDEVLINKAENGVFDATEETAEYTNIDTTIVPSTSEDSKSYTHLNEETAEYTNNDMIIVPSTSADSKSYTHLNISTTVHPSALQSEYTTVEFFTNDAVPSLANRSNIPPNTDWPGVYDFQVSFQMQEKSTKSTAWTYSELKKKLFVNMAVACPVNIHVKSQPPHGCVIRAMSIFSMPEHITDVVKRCLNHSSSADPMNEGHPAPDHLIRCDNPSSKYVVDYNTKRHSVITDYEHPQVGMGYSTYLYRFMCLGSCVGGLNRRPLQLILTLEKDGQCLGRRVMGLRICACPGRDKRTEEKQFEKPKRNISYPKATLDVISGPSMKRQNSSSGDEESAYTVTVYRRSHYEIVKKVADALELADLASLLTSEETSALQQRYVKSKRRKIHQSQDNHSSEESST